MLLQHLDWVALHQFDRFFDLRSEQKKALRTPIEETILWYKRERLPELVHVLAQIEEAAKVQAVEARQLDLWLLTLDQHRLDLIGQLAPHLIPVAMTLDEDQRAHFQKRLEDREKKRRKLLAKTGEDFEEALTEHIEGIGDSFDSWLGPLRKDQLSLLRETLGIDRALLQAQMDQRQRFQAAWLAILAQKNPETLASGFSALLSRDRSDLQPADRALLGEQRKAWRRFWIALGPSLEPKQWKRLEHFAGELRQELGAQIPTGPIAKK
jgi:hypothetical protein